MMTSEEQGLDGLALVEGMRDGRHPASPFMVSLGLRVTEARRGRVVVDGTPGGDHLNHAGFVHGGYLSALMDTATAFALPHRARAVRVAVYFAREACGPLSPLSSSRRVSDMRRVCSRVSSDSIRARRSWTTCDAASGRPNCTRCRA